MSNEIYTLDAEVRANLGTSASRRLRKENKVPAILYGADKEAQSLSFEHKTIIKAQENEGFYTHILTLNIAGEPVQAILKDMQRHPFKPVVTHLDFQRVDANHKIHTKLPIHFIGEEVIAKTGATVLHQATEIEVSCLPADLPEFVEIDVSALEAGVTLHISDVKLPEGVSSVELIKGHDLAVANIKVPKAQAEDTEEEAAAE